MSDKSSFLHSTHLLAGAMAGLAVDLTLFPLDTIKTRVQAKEGWRAAGGWRNLYSGASAVLLGSAPSAALFFGSYEGFKRVIGGDDSHDHGPLVHLISACLGEITACVIRVPVEVIKQRSQVRQYQGRWPLITAFRTIYGNEGLLGFYRGFLATVQREIPFAALQYPLYEGLKGRWATWQEGKVSSGQAAVCGSIAGAITALFTTPLDVIKTRTMLARETEVMPGALKTLKMLWREGGIRTVFAGAVPRVLWISFGGFVFFGTYETTQQLLNKCK